MNNMSEYVHVPTSLWGIHHDIAIAALAMLAQQGNLPADFEFIALAIEGQEDRQQIALQDVCAALGVKNPSGHPYLTQELPDCVTVSVGGTKSRTDILREVSVDYHQLGTLLGIADEQEIALYHGYQAWAGYVKFLDPRKYASLQKTREPGLQRSSFSKVNNFKSGLLDIVIRDSALIPIYENPKLVPGHGSIKQKLLSLLIQDNHPWIEIVSRE